MSEPSQDGNAKIDEAGEFPPLKREYSRRFQTMSGEDILNNRVGSQVSTHINLIDSMMKGELHSQPIHMASSPSDENLLKFFYSFIVLSSLNSYCLLFLLFLSNTETSVYTLHMKIPKLPIKAIVLLLIATPTLLIDPTFLFF